MAAVASLKKPQLKEKYEREIALALQEQMGARNRYEVPKVVKVVVNAGIGEASQDPKYLDQAMQDLALITGQKPVVRRAKKAIAAFKIRKGHSLGVKVTLRGNRCYFFLEKLFNIVLPRMRDFRGVSAKQFDGRGNYNLGIREQSLFPEVNLDRIERTFGLDIAIVTTAQTDEEAKMLLTALGLPLR